MTFWLSVGNGWDRRVYRRRPISSLPGGASNLSWRLSLFGYRANDLLASRISFTLGLAADRRDRPLKFNAHYAGRGIAFCQLFQLVYVRRRPGLARPSLVRRVCLARTLLAD